MKAAISTLAACLIMTGCSQFSMQLMSRTDGKVYHGSAKKTADGQGTITIAIGDTVYKGHFSRTGAEQKTPLADAFAKPNTLDVSHPFSNSPRQVFTGSATFMSILASDSGDGMRCTGHGDMISGTGTGVCVDGKNNTYDMIYHKTSGLF